MPGNHKISPQFEDDWGEMPESKTKEKGEIGGGNIAESSLQNTNRGGSGTSVTVINENMLSENSTNLSSFDKNKTTQSPISGNMKENVMQTDNNLRQRHGYQRSNTNSDQGNAQNKKNKDKFESVRLETYIQNKFSAREWTPPLTIRKRDKIYDGTTDEKLSGCSAIRQSWKRSWHKFNIKWREFTYRLQLWGRALRSIEGMQGTGVVSYFVFLKWILWLDIFIFLLMFFFITLPMEVLSGGGYTTAVTGTTVSAATVTTAQTCSAAYGVTYSSDAGQLIIDFFQGTGWMEKTALFYGHYSNEELEISGTSFQYNMPLAFLLVTLSCFVLSLILMARNTAKSFKDGVMRSHQSQYGWWNKCFGSWDYALSCEKTSVIKQRSIRYDICSDLEEKRFLEAKKNRTCGDNCKLYTIRFFVNFFVLICLGGAGYLIYYVTDWSSSYTNSSDVATKNQVLVLVVSYLPSIVITVLNVILPLIFGVVVLLEKYTQAFVIKITLIRIVFLKLASLALLISSIYTTITCTPQDSCRIGTSSCTALSCWQTFVGQQFYKLVILDFIVSVLSPFIVELPRKLIVKYCVCGLTKKIGPPEFNITKSVLDLIYSQTLLWLGFFFVPLLPSLAVLKLIILFYVKYLSALFICSPAEKPFKASRSNSFFMIVLLLSFFLCCFPIVFVVYQVAPSRSCGSHRIYDYMSDIIKVVISNLPTFFEVLSDIVTSTAFAVALIVLLCLCIYYCRTLAAVNKEVAENYRHQINAESKDKRYLMMKITELSGEVTPGYNKSNTQRPNQNINQNRSQSPVREQPPKNLYDVEKNAGGNESWYRQPPNVKNAAGVNHGGKPVRPDGSPLVNNSRSGNTNDVGRGGSPNRYNGFDDDGYDNNDGFF